MFNLVLKLFLRNFVSNFTYSVIALIGLAIGIGSFLSVALYITHELNYDNHAQDKSNTYRVIKYFEEENIEFDSYSPPPLAKAVSQEIPGIKAVSRFMPNAQLKCQYKDLVFLESVYAADSDFFTLFTYDFVNRQQKILDEPFTIVLSNELAFKIFKSNDCLGEFIQIGEHEYKITGVYLKHQYGSHFDFDILISFNSIEDIRGEKWLSKSWNVNCLSTYILLNEVQSKAKIEKSIENIVNLRSSSNGLKRRIILQPLKDIHLKSGFIKYDSHNLNKGSISSVRIFFLISILVLSVSLINYINLNTISSVKRFKEIGLRKVLGSDKLEIRKHYFSESILNTFIAYLLAILLIFIFLPSINNLFSFEISIMDFFQIDFLIFSALLILCASILSSFYQSIYLGKLNPMSILKGSNIRSAKTSLFQKILLVLQYSIALFMISFSYYVFTQMNYIQNVDLGYSNDNVIELNISNKNIRSNLNSLKNELVRNPHIKHVSASLYANKALNNTYFSEKGSKSKVHMYYNSIDSSFLKTLNIELLQGRNIKEIKHTTEFTDVVINESAVKSFGWDDAIGKTIHPNYRVVGVVSNYCFLPLNESGYAPMLFFYLPNQFNKLLIKTDGKNEESTIAFIKAKWREVMNNEPLNLKKLDSYFLDDYQREVKLKKLFVILTIIAITLTLSGLIVLTINSINNKKKEIVIRRVHGASSMQVIKLIYQEILILLIISLTIALPFAVLFIEKWLANFAFRIQLDAFVFITICIVLFVIATFTIAFQLYLASKIDPVKVLKYE